MSNLFKGSYIKLDRVIMQWEWYKNSDVKSVFIHCLMKANFENKLWQGISIQRGQFVTSYSKLANETGLTVRKIRTSLNRLKSTQELTYKTTPQYTIITVNKYNEYQTNDITNDNQMTINRQSNDNQMTTTNNDNNENNENNENKVCVCAELGEKEKIILVNYAKKSNARNIDAYINELIKNGGYKDIIQNALDEEKKKKEMQAQQRPPKIEEISDEERVKIEQIMKDYRENHLKNRKIIQ